MIVKENMLSNALYEKLNHIKESVNGMVTIPVFNDNLNKVVGVIYGKPGELQFKTEPDDPQVKRTKLAINSALSDVEWEQGRFALPIGCKINPERPYEYFLPLSKNVYMNEEGTCMRSLALNPQYAVCLTDKVMSKATKHLKVPNLFHYTEGTFIYKFEDIFIFINPNGSWKEAVDIQTNTSTPLSLELKELIDKVIESIHEQTYVDFLPLIPVPKAISADFRELNDRIIQLVRTQKT